MLTKTIPSYLYQQYADDDDLQAFVDSYNDATQTYVDWFVNVCLPFYPGLSGDLLTWVGEGLYGLPKTALQQSGKIDSGPLNSQELNAAVLDSFTPGSQTIYALDDDSYQRLLTWHLYKADGNRFTIRWLKRRIMRFLVGAHGIDPWPGSPGFVVGGENTGAISVSIANSTLTVLIDKTALSSLIAVKAGILSLFKTAFEGGALELPAQYSYIVNIV